jgi:membrane protease subunit HflC
LRAIADRQAGEIVAAAQRDSEILRGEGDAQRSAVYAAAYNQDPEFFNFYRSMEAYRTAMQANGTTMVLSPDSEFFQYFGTISGTRDAGTSTAGAAAQGVPMLPLPALEEAAAAGAAEPEPKPDLLASPDAETTTPAVPMAPADPSTVAPQ